MKTCRNFIIIIIILSLTSCTNFTQRITSKKWKLPEYSDWYLIIDEGDPVGYIHYRLKQYFNENGEQRYQEDSERKIYTTTEEGKLHTKITKSWAKLDRELNLLQFQFYSSPMYKDDTEKFIQGVIEDDTLKVATNEGQLMDLKLNGSKLPSILNFRYLIKEMDLNKGNVQDYEYFSIRYLTLIEEKIVYAGEEEVKYKGDWVLADKFLAVPFNDSDNMDSFYFDKSGQLILSTMFQGKMYIMLTTRTDIIERFKQ